MLPFPYSKPLRLYLFVTFLFLANAVPDFVFPTGSEPPDVVREALGPAERALDSGYIMIAGRFAWRVPKDGVAGQAFRLIRGPEIQDPDRVQALVVGRLACFRSPVCTGCCTGSVSASSCRIWSASYIFTPWGSW